MFWRTSVWSAGGLARRTAGGPPAFLHQLESKIPTIRFIDEVKIQLREDDGGLTLEDDYMIRFIELLPFGEENVIKKTMTFKDEEGDGLYRFFFTLAHALDK